MVSLVPAYKVTHIIPFLFYRCIHHSRIPCEDFVEIRPRFYGDENFTQLFKHASVTEMSGYFAGDDFMFVTLLENNIVKTSTGAVL